MSEPFIAEIRMMGFNFPPKGWAKVDGQIMPINQNQSLYSLLGTTYGGDGRTTFALPDLRSRTPIHKGEGHALGQRAGQETVKLSVAEMGVHSHDVIASADLGDNPNPKGRLLATVRKPDMAYRAYQLSTSTSLTSSTVSGEGGGQGHYNMQPFLGVNFCIALLGLFPSRN